MHLFGIMRIQNEQIFPSQKFSLVPPIGHINNKNLTFSLVGTSADKGRRK